MQLDHRNPPKPDNTGPSATLLKEAVVSVDGLSKSIREFPEGWNRANHLNETACGLAVAFGLVVGLLIAGIARKGK